MKITTKTACNGYYIEEGEDSFVDHNYTDAAERITQIAERKLRKLMPDLLPPLDSMPDWVTINITAETSSGKKLIT